MVGTLIQRIVPAVVTSVALAAALALPQAGSAQGTKADYERADALRDRTRGRVFKARVEPHWFDGNDRFWYRNDLADGAREFVVVDDPLPAGLEAVDQSLRTTGSLPPYEGAPKLEGDSREGPVGQKWLYGSWDGGWWTPWEHKEIRDDRVLWFARQLWRGSYQASYVARATTAGRFVRPPAQAEEMYNPAVHGRSEGGVFSIWSRPGRTEPLTRATLSRPDP